jgi:hypothetical protein
MRATSHLCIYHIIEGVTLAEQFTVAKDATIQQESLFLVVAAGENLIQSGGHVIWSGDMSVRKPNLPKVKPQQGRIVLGQAARGIEQGAVTADHNHQIASLRPAASRLASSIWPWSGQNSCGGARPAGISTSRRSAR